MRNDDFDDYRSGYLDYEEINRIVAQKMAGCILWMVVGLLVSGITGYLAIYNDAIRTIVAGSYYVLFFVELGLVFMFSMMIMKASVGMLRGMFLIYAVLNGLTLSIIG